MFETKNLISEHGVLKVQVLFTLKDGTKYVDYGYSQSVNVANHFKQMLEEAILNALYKVNHRLGYTIFSKENYNEDIYQYIENYYLTEYTISYYEDRRYRFQDAGNSTIVYRDDKVYKTEPVKSYEQEQLNKTANERI